MPAHEYANSKAFLHLRAPLFQDFEGCERL
jgi:hypothetical protein